MNIIAHKLVHEPVNSYMINDYIPGNRSASIYLHPTTCMSADDSGSTVEEYGYSANGLTHNIYAGKPATRSFAVYTCEYDSEPAVSLMFMVRHKSFDVLNHAIELILNIYFHSIISIEPKEVKIYQDKNGFKIYVRRLD